MKVSVLLLSGTILLAPLTPAPVVAQSVQDACILFSNISFENGNLGGWTLTAPNADYILTPTGANPIIDPVINPADPANNPATLTAAVGNHFTGGIQIGDTATDLKYKLAHVSTPVSFPIGTTVQVKVWANRGRLEPFDTPASTGDVLVRIFGWSAGAQPTVSTADNWTRTITWNPAAQSFDFTGVSDGTWGSQTFTFGPTTAALAWLSISIAGRNNNHDQYVALDLCDASTAVESKPWGSIKQLYR